MKSKKAQKSDKKAASLLTVVSIILLIVMMIGTTFSFFTARVFGTFNSVNIETAELGTAVAEGTAVFLHVTKEDMLIENGRNNYSVYKEANSPGSLVITATMGNFDGRVSCVYDVLYRPGTAYIASAANTAHYREFSIYGSQSLRRGGQYATFSGTMPERDLTGVVTPVTLVSGARLEVRGRRNTASVVWSIMPRYYNLAIDQSDNANKMFGGSVEVGSLACRYSF